LCTTDRVLIVKGRIDRKEGETKIVALELSAFESVPEKREVRLKIDRRKPPRGRFTSCGGLIEDFPGESPATYADLTTSQGKKGLRLRPAVQGRARAGLLRRGEDAARRVRDRLATPHPV